MSRFLKVILFVLTAAVAVAIILSTTGAQSQDEARLVKLEQSVERLEAENASLTAQIKAVRDFDISDSELETAIFDLQTRDSYLSDSIDPEFARKELERWLSKGKLNDDESVALLIQAEFLSGQNLLTHKDLHRIKEVSDPRWDEWVETLTIN
jgi:cell division protein FtsB